MQDSDETNGLTQSPELLKPKPKVEQSSEKGRVMVTEAMRDIKETERFVGHTTSASGAELTAATDDALVFVADETVKSADQDGVRTDVEKVDIRKSLQAVVVEGAMVESGNKPTTSDNPIVSLDKAGRDKEVTAMIKELKAEGAKLPTGEDVALMAELARINQVGYGANVGTGDESGDEQQAKQEQVDEDENEPESEVDDGEPDLDSDDTNEDKDEAEAEKDDDQTTADETEADLDNSEEESSTSELEEDSDETDADSTVEPSDPKSDPFDQLERWKTAK
ncbi:DNA polymerase V family protein [Candidatus Saccharibacteria bacterium]|nr:DNA polymerase V family protein [Candidatus Saccharibacteria bacterium]